jgi:hypothetical protein
MTPPHGGYGLGVTDRVIDVLVSPSRHAPTMIASAYLLAIVGLGLTLVVDPYGEGTLSMVGLVCMVVSFLVLFYTSLTVLDSGG